ncbi:hypothetical protein Golob_022153, partial [Gossypium lobatum]|nr:hypothetical protein [Gossypium lobatum]
QIPGPSQPRSDSPSQKTTKVRLFQSRSKFCSVASVFHKEYGVALKDDVAMSALRRVLRLDL